MTAAFGRGALLRSALVVTSATYLTYVTGLIVSTIIARSLGPAEFGRYSYVVWMSGIVTAACVHGLTTTGIKFVAECVGREDEATAAGIYRLLRRYFMLSVALVAVICAVALPATMPEGWSLGLAFLALAVLASGIPKAYYLFHASIAKGYGNFRVEANTTNLMSIAGLLAALVLAFLSQPLAAYLGVFVLLGVGHALLTHRFMRSTSIRVSDATVDPVLLARLKSHLGWTIVLVLMATLSNRTVETFLLNRHAGAEAVGFFVIAATLVRGGTDLLVNGLTAILIPAMAHSYGRGGNEQVGAILSNSSRYFLFLGLMLAGVGVCLAPLVVHLMYGDGYASVVGAFNIMVVAAGLTLSESAFNALLTTTDRQRMRVMLTAIAVCVAALLALWLVPRYGLEGAVWAHVLARSVMFVVMVVIALRTTRVRLPWGAFASLLFAALAAAAVAWLVFAAPMGLYSGIPAAVVYGAVLLTGSLLLRTWTAQDLEMLGVLGQRVPLLRGMTALVARLGSRRAG